jgi:lipid II:glycine glycyltransferase (peptidoglycan interpeptide bridge formation enzyme)
MDENKVIYNTLCEKEFSIPIFSQAWWLDAVAGEKNWNIVMVKSNNEILATLPYYSKKFYGFNILTQPIFTQNLGPWIKNKQTSPARCLAFQKDLLQELYNQLPKFDYYKHNWHYSFTNWLPLYWLGYNQTTRYTYILKNIKNISNIVNNFEHSKRKNLKKAKKLVKIVYDISAEEFYNNHSMTLKKQKKKISYNFEVFKKLYDECYLRNKGKTIGAYDVSGNLHAALFVVWDANSAYNLVSTIDPDFRTYGASALLIENIINYTSKYVDKFDFTGSMLETVERSIRQYGPEQVPYFSLTQFRSKFIKIIYHLRKSN